MSEPGGGRRGDGRAAALRVAGLDALGPGGEPRARDALVHGHLSVAEAVAEWEGSVGRVVAHRVTLALDAARLGGLRAAPAAVDALAAALARAVASAPGETMHGLELTWSRSAALGGAGARHGYRGAPPAGRESPGAALAAYLEAAGESDLAALVRHGTVTLDPGGESVRVVLPPGLLLRLATRRLAASTLSTAARDLFGLAKARVAIVT